MTRRSAAVLLAVGLVTAACGTPQVGTLGPAPTAGPVSNPVASSDPPTTSPATPTGATTAPAPGTAPVPPSTAAPDGTVTVQLWFVRDGRLVPTRRTGPATVATSRLTITELTAGPTPVEAATGMTTGVPAGTAFTVDIAGGTATVDLDAAFHDGDAATVRLRRAQVVYSLTQFPSVSRVRFRSAGRVVGEPAGRDAYADLLPPIVVTAPAIGTAVPAPVTVTGSADVYEATVSWRLLDSGGREVATGFTLASCGSGCRGEFQVRVDYRVGTRQPGILEVFWVSAKDGSAMDVVRVPVILEA